MPPGRYKMMSHDREDGKADLTPWVPHEPHPTELQEIERRRSANVNTRLDPKVVTSNPLEIGFQSSASRRPEHNFDPILAENAKKCGYKNLRIVQACVLPYLMKGADAALLTLGGTGKTVAYLLPLIQRVHDDLKRHRHEKCYVRAVILVNSKEQAKYTLDMIRALTDGMNIRSALMVSQMTHDAFANRDNADILITTAFLFLENLNVHRLTTLYLRYFVVDGFDDIRKEWNFMPETIDKVLEFVKEISKTQFVYVADDPDALQQPYWNELIVGSGGSKIVIIENNPEIRLPPMKHLFIRTRGDGIIPAVAETIWQAGNGGQSMVLITNRVHQQQTFIDDLQEFLKKNEIDNKYYHTQMCMGDREAVLRSFSLGEFPVLITKFTCQLRNYRFPDLKQVIHIGPPYHRDESYTTAYSYSSRCVSFCKDARSVVLFNVDDYHQAGKNITELVQAIKSSEIDSDGPKFKVPDWVRHFMETKETEWRPVDKIAANQKADLLQQLPEEEFPENLPRFDEPPVEMQRNRRSGVQDTYPPPGLPNLPRFDEPPVEMQRNNRSGVQNIYPPGLPALGLPLLYKKSSPVVVAENIPVFAPSSPESSYASTRPPGLPSPRKQPRYAERPVENEQQNYARRNISGRRRIVDSEDSFYDSRPTAGQREPENQRRFDEPAAPVDNYATRERRNEEFQNYSRSSSGVPGPSQPRFYDEYGHEEQSYQAPQDNRRRNDSFSSHGPTPHHQPIPQQNNYRQQQPQPAPYSSGNNYPNTNYRENQQPPQQTQEFWNSSRRFENGGNGQQRGQDYGSQGWIEGYEEYNEPAYDYNQRQGGYERPSQPQHPKPHFQENDRRYRDEFQAPMNQMNNQRNGYSQPPQQQIHHQQQGRFHEEQQQRRYNDFGHQPVQQQNQYQGGQEQQRQGYGQGYERPPQQQVHQQQQGQYQGGQERPALQQQPQNRYPHPGPQERFDEPPRQMERNRQPQYNDYRQDDFRRRDEEQQQHFGNHHPNNSGGQNSRRPQGFDPRRSSFSSSSESRNYGESSGNRQENHRPQNYGRNDFRGEDFGHGSQNFNGRSDFGRHDDRRGGEFQQQQQRPADRNFGSQDCRFEKNPQVFRNGERRDDGYRSDFPKTTNDYFYGMPDKPPPGGRQSDNVGSLGRRFQTMTVYPSRSTQSFQGNERRNSPNEGETGPSGSRDGHQRSGENRNSFRGRGVYRGGNRSPQKNRSPVKKPSGSFGEFAAKKSEYEARAAKQAEEDSQEGWNTVATKEEDVKASVPENAVAEEKEPVAKNKGWANWKSSETEEEADAEDSDDETHFRTGRRQRASSPENSESEDVV